MNEGKKISFARSYSYLRVIAGAVGGGTGDSPVVLAGSVTLALPSTSASAAVKLKSAVVGTKNQPGDFFFPN